MATMPTAMCRLATAALLVLAAAANGTRHPSACTQTADQNTCGSRSIDASIRIRHWMHEVQTQDAIARGHSDSKVISGAEAQLGDCYLSGDIKSAFLIEETREQPVELVGLNGKGRIELVNGSRLESDHFAAGLVKEGLPLSVWLSDGKTRLLGASTGGCLLHGLVRGIDVDTANVTLMTTFVRGRVVGPTWHVLQSYDAEAAFVGAYYQKHPTFDLTSTSPLWKSVRGEDVAFVYPDLLTCMRGRMENGEFRGVRQAEIVQAEENEDGVLELTFDESFGPSFEFDLSNKTSISGTPMLRDPYEARTVAVRESSIPGAGQGVFVTRDVPAFTVVSYFNGVRIKEKDVFRQMKKSPYLVEIGEGDDFLDVPGELSNWNNYQASAGHKINHGKKANGRYTECEHPRFGLVHCMQITKDLKAGEELVCRYDVTFNKQSMKSMFQTVLNFGHMFSGKPKKEFIKDIRPYVEAASKLAENIEIDSLLPF